jgi:hypothetical protein
MKIQENVIVYQCEHCSKKLFRKHAMINHEESCKSNPENMRACHYCTFLTKQTCEVPSGYPDYFGREGERQVELLFCGKINSYLYPPSVTAKGNSFETGDLSNVEMLKECEFENSSRNDFKNQQLIF